MSKEKEDLCGVLYDDVGAFHSVLANAIINAKNAKEIERLLNRVIERAGELAVRETDPHRSKLLVHTQCVRDDAIAALCVHSSLTEEEKHMLLKTLLYNKIDLLVEGDFTYLNESLDVLSKMKSTISLVLFIESVDMAPLRLFLNAHPTDDARRLLIENVPSVFDTNERTRAMWRAGTTPYVDVESAVAAGRILFYLDELAERWNSGEEVSEVDELAKHEVPLERLEELVHLIQNPESVLSGASLERGIALLEAGMAFYAEDWRDVPLLDMVAHSTPLALAERERQLQGDGRLKDLSSAAARDLTEIKHSSLRELGFLDLESRLLRRAFSTDAYIQRVLEKAEAWILEHER